ncbi:hypothetical protein ASG88_03310 [Nocardioides sp. Soil777]|uniref:hypothetical protein n=1 Tax=Nocardioides sp. Soil777 TaxID=1736409 RepID=UPI000702B6F2|nr:hypothetical protein [Nocardioides sp. Soil777]KRF07843.1 hypothetical protein ASG88_03310 [Nocardioides sp. Soil777]
MGSFTSTLYTIGTALSRAQDADVAVDLLVTGQWIHGHVSALDGHGVVLHGDGDELSIIRMGSIDAVKVAQAATFEGRPQVEAAPDATAHPMPAAPADRAV